MITTAKAITKEKKGRGKMEEKGKGSQEEVWRNPNLSFQEPFLSRVTQVTLNYTSSYL